MKSANKNILVSHSIIPACKMSLQHVKFLLCIHLVTKFHCWVMDKCVNLVLDKRFSSCILESGSGSQLQAKAPHQLHKRPCKCCYLLFSGIHFAASVTLVTILWVTFQQHCTSRAVEHCGHILYVCECFVVNVSFLHFVWLCFCD